jgi:hypothetical protein
LCFARITLKDALLLLDSCHILDHYAIAFAHYQGHVQVVVKKTSYQGWDLPQVISILEMDLTLFALIWALCHLTGRKLILREGRCTL